MIASGPFDVSRLAPVIVIVALFFSVWQVLRRSRRRRAQVVGHFVEVWVGDDDEVARQMALEMRWSGFAAVANEEPDEDDEATMTREHPGDGRPFVAVREHQADEARRFVAQWLVDQQADRDSDEERVDDENDGFTLAIAPGDEFDEADEARRKRTEVWFVRLLVLPLLGVFCFYLVRGLFS